MRVVGVVVLVLTACGSPPPVTHATVAAPSAKPPAPTGDLGPPEHDWHTWAPEGVDGGPSIPWCT